jgi:ketosteroid isomerase-like protein
MEVVKAGYAAWNTADMDALRELYAPDAMIVRGLEGWPESGPQIGRDAIIRYFQQLRETWENDTLEPVSDFAEVGDRVVVRQHWRGTGQGPELDIEFTSITNAQRQDLPRRVFLGPRRGSRVSRAFGVGDVAGERGACTPTAGPVRQG